MRSQILAILLIAATLMIPSRSLAEPAELVDFAFEDQFRNVHRRADVQGKIVLLIGSDKGGSSFNGSWSQAIRASLKDHPEYDQISELPYSDLRGVPFFMKGFIRSKFPEDPDHAIAVHTLADQLINITVVDDLTGANTSCLLVAPLQTGADSAQPTTSNRP